MYMQGQGQKVICHSQFCPSPTWVIGAKLRW